MAITGAHVLLYSSAAVTSYGLRVTGYELSGGLRVTSYGWAGH